MVFASRTSVASTGDRSPRPRDGPVSRRRGLGPGPLARPRTGLYVRAGGIQTQTRTCLEASNTKSRR
eukprot:4707986-Lingulodinium_polyedra.AAC.1